MMSVTKRIKQVKQPRGGYLKPKDFIVTDLLDTEELYDEENVHGTLIGIAVDYLTRFLNGTPAEEAFRISLQGAVNIRKQELANKLLLNIQGLDNISIDSACKLAGFDVVFRAGIMGYRPVEDINPDKETIANIRIMVNRSLNFLEKYGPIIKDGFTFEGGYSSTVSSGDGDFLTEDTLWDFKVSKNPPTNKHTLQLLMYYLMGIRSIHPEFKSVVNLGFFNPRLNKVYLLPINTIPAEVIEEINSIVIGY